jgi:glutaredoxin
MSRIIRHSPRPFPMLGLTPIVLAALLFGPPAPAHGEIYKWTDAQGNLQLSDRPPPDRNAEHVEVRSTPAPAVRSADIGQTAAPAAGQPVPAPPPKRVVMYGAQWCGYCKQARSYFAAHKVPYTEHDVDRDPKARREFERLGGRGVPLILVGEARLKGFSEDGFERLYMR